MGAGAESAPPPPASKGGPDSAPARIAASVIGQVPTGIFGARVSGPIAGAGAPFSGCEGSAFPLLGAVHLQMSCQAPARYALKLQLKRDQRQAQSEVLALRRAAHPFIVHLERAFSFDRFLALLLELCPTDLNRKLCDPDDSGKCLGLSAFDAARYIGQILLALAFLHKDPAPLRDCAPLPLLFRGSSAAQIIWGWAALPYLRRIPGSPQRRRRPKLRPRE